VVHQPAQFAGGLARGRQKGSAERALILGSGTPMS
jgi:hypothetical protein